MVTASPKALPKHEEYVIMDGSEYKWTTVNVYSMPKDRTEPLTCRSETPLPLQEGMKLARQYERKGHVIELRRESPVES
jgi:hypothetical protein